MTLSRRLVQARTLARLGPRSIARVLAYRALKKSGWYARHLPVGSFGEHGAFFQKIPSADAPAIPATEQTAIIAQADEIVAGRLRLYGWLSVDAGFPIAWRRNPISDAEVSEGAAHWSRQREPNPIIGDIKDVWEASRFEWAVTLAMAWRLSQAEKYRAALETLYSDWASQNPPNAGPNWLCGQETSIRLLNTLETLRILGLRPEAYSPAVLRWLEIHLERIAATLDYGVGQDNNHGVSEAVALAVGGAMLRNITNGRRGKAAERAMRLGSKVLEDRCRRLFFADGGFSQYSTTYHRLVLDTLSLAAEWSRRLDAAAIYPATVREVHRRALGWMAAVTDAVTGDAPNLGANDGANPYRLLHTASYRDFRGSIARAAMAAEAAAPAFCAEQARAIAPWLERPVPEFAPPSADRRPLLLADTGLAMVSSPDGMARASLRGANFRFRPSHSDMGHVDYWHEGVPVLADGGSYRYAFARDEPQVDLASARAHNTILADDKDPMLRLGRFLFGGWTRAELAIGGENAVECRYRGENGWGYVRRVTVAEEGDLLVDDRIKGVGQPVVLRWFFAGSDWEVAGDGALSPQFRLRLSAAGADLQLAVEPAQRSTHYARQTETKVLVVRLGSFAGEASIRTRVSRRPTE